MRVEIRSVLLLWFVLTSADTAEENQEQQQEQQLEQQKQDDPDTIEYGADISFPCQHDRIKEQESVSIFGNRINKQAFYESIVRGCAMTYDMERCHMSERKRIQRNLERPMAMKNFTRNGFAKITTPPDLWKLVQEFWKTNSFKGVQEQWEFGQTSVNHWESPTYMVDLYDASLPGGGRELERAVWDASQSTLETWTGQKLQGCSLYGVRVYTENAILVPHVDRTPLVSSAIINVAQDTEEPWPLEVIGHDGKAHNITMEPGDMVLYESHSIIHGRPFPLKGKFYANIFVHFEPVEVDGVLPYVDPTIAGAAMYKEMMDDRAQQYSKAKAMNLEAHHLAGNGRTDEIRQLVDRQPDYTHFEDKMGWKPIHEAARGGHIETIHYLLERGADVNSKTLHGATPLYIAEAFNGAESEVVRFLKSRGAESEEPIKTDVLHGLAGDGKLDEFKEVIERNPRLLQVPDDNEWTPLHEAARGGHVDVVEYLVQKGAHLNKQTKAGGTAMWYAAHHHGEDSAVYQYFKHAGALELGPDSEAGPEL